MALITRQGKGSKLTIQEMDGNLKYLNNGNKLLCKQTVNLNPALISLANPVIITGECINNLVHFIVGETVTNDLGGTAIVVTESIPNLGGGGGAIEIGCGFGTSRRRLTLSNVTGTWIGMSTITSSDSEITTSISRYYNSAYEDTILSLDSTGSKFIVTDVLITNMLSEGLASDEVNVSGLIYDSPFGVSGNGYFITSLSTNFLTDPRYWVATSIIPPSNGGGAIEIGSNVKVTVGNNLYFTISEGYELGVDGTADLYVYGYILE